MEINVNHCYMTPTVDVKVRRGQTKQSGVN